MRITPILLAMLMMGGTLLGISSLYGGVQLAYAPTGSNTANSTTFVKYNQTMSDISSTMSDIENHTISITNQGWNLPGIIVDTSLLFLSVGKVLVQIPNMAVSYISYSFGFLDFMGGAGWFITVITLAVIVIIIMRIVAMFLRSDEV